MLLETFCDTIHVFSRFKFLKGRSFLQHSGCFNHLALLELAQNFSVSVHHRFNFITWIQMKSKLEKVHYDFWVDIGNKVGGFFFGITVFAMQYGKTVVMKRIREREKSHTPELRCTEEKRLHVQPGKGKKRERIWMKIEMEVIQRGNDRERGE